MYSMIASCWHLVYKRVWRHHEELAAERFSERSTHLSDEDVGYSILSETAEFLEKRNGVRWRCGKSLLNNHSLGVYSIISRARRWRRLSIIIRFVNPRIVDCFRPHEYQRHTVEPLVNRYMYMYQLQALYYSIDYSLHRAALMLGLHVLVQSYTYTLYLNSDDTILSACDCKINEMVFCIRYL